MRDWTERLLAVGLVAVLAAYGASYGIRSTQINIIDRQGDGTKFLMSNSGTSLPATCQVGDYFFKTNATAGQNVYGCTALNTWTLQGDGAGSTIPTGTVAFFNLSSCPTGWSEYTTLRGKYAVGLVSGGTLEGGSGTALTNQESRAVGQHNHTASNAAHSHTVTIFDNGHVHSGSHTHTGTVSTAVTEGSPMYSLAIGNTSGDVDIHAADITASSNSQTPAITVANTGSVAGTNAPYVQLLSCRKS